MKESETQMGDRSPLVSFADETKKRSDVKDDFSQQQHTAT